MSNTQWGSADTDQHPAARASVSPNGGDGNGDSACPTNGGAVHAASNGGSSRTEEPSPRLQPAVVATVTTTTTITAATPPPSPVIAVIQDTSPSWAGPSNGSEVMAVPEGDVQQRGDRVSPVVQNNNNSAGSAQQDAGDKQAKTCCFCWCCCCSCSWRGSRPVYASLQKPVKLSSLAVKSNNGNVRSPRENNQRLTTGDNFLNGDGEPPPTVDEIRTWGDSFEKLMKCSAGRKVFRDFLKCEYSEENILFWLACEDLKQESNPEIIEEKARAIYEDYISILSPKEVSLDSRVREIINRNMVEPTPHTFDEAQLQIYTLMHRDSYPRFVNSPLFRKLAQLPSPSRKGSAA
ncbi:regulator of G-protein signaling 20 [Ixodes scapularis]|uniref:regulator of G-protein signaling 20 n=1 Tax=Ixodes scapularis TaxID=6945 RepID=UPI001A9DACBB|nr:regulator of G-protein signaling 20 [Ixodes scapularis]